MDLDLLRNQIAEYVAHRQANPAKYAEMDADREAHAQQIQGWTKTEILVLDDEGLFRFISPLWAMLIWGNKHYVVDKLISENGLPALRDELANLIWGNEDLEKRWDRFRANIKGMGPAMMSEILCHMHPKTCPIWNRRAKAGLVQLDVDGIPKYDYQVTGKRYLKIAKDMQIIASELGAQGIAGANLLSVDYFIWDQLQSDTPLSSSTGSPSSKTLPAEGLSDAETSRFIHNEVRDKLADIGEWLGFSTNVETKVADGSVVDTIWQATIGNMGRVIYVFEVQTKGSIDSLILNLLKSLNNPAVQGVVAVSDKAQLEKIKKHAAGVTSIGAKLRYWDYEEVLSVHSSLEGVNEAINKLGLVPQGFTS